MQRMVVTVVPFLVACSCAVQSELRDPGSVPPTSAEVPTSAVSSPPPSSPAPGRERALVTRVVDGDTIEVRLDGAIVDVRLIGIDTPETVAPGTPVACFGPEASAFTTERLAGREVHLEVDVETFDRYGRLLAYVWIGDELFNESLVDEGYAVVTTYPPNVAYVDRFVAAQRRAREAGRGFWSACAPGGGSGVERCDPAYPDVCIPSPPPDLDCADVVFRRFRVEATDPHNFDGDHNGLGCEAS
jgi:micrococcal nuclease